MRIKETKVYPFDELSDDAKEKAIEGVIDINVNYEWWDCIFDDAKNALLELKSFDLDRRRHCTGNFIESAKDTAEKIIKEHGKKCETFQTATNYLKEHTELVEKYSDGKQLDIVIEDNEYDFENECDSLDDEFLKSILEDYSIMLQKEYEYLMSEEAIIETIKANEYEFTVDGKLV